MYTELHNNDPIVCFIVLTLLGPSIVIDQICYTVIYTGVTDRLQSPVSSESNYDIYFRDVSILHYRPPIHDRSCFVFAAQSWRWGHLTSTCISGCIRCVSIEVRHRRKALLRLGFFLSIEDDKKENKIDCCVVAAQSWRWGRLTGVLYSVFTIYEYCTYFL